MDNLWNMTFWQMVLIITEFVGSATAVGMWLAIVYKVFTSFGLNITINLKDDR